MLSECAPAIIIIIRNLCLTAGETYKRILNYMHNICLYSRLVLLDWKSINGEISYIVVVHPGMITHFVIYYSPRLQIPLINDWRFLFASDHDINYHCPPICKENCECARCAGLYIRELYVMKIYNNNFICSRRTMKHDSKYSISIACHSSWPKTQ